MILGRFGRRKSSGGAHPVLPFDKVVNKTHLKADTKILWECVSVSRSQFEDHYIGLIRNVAVYMQDEEVFRQAMLKGTEALQETMIVRLPHDRSREQGAKYEQLWKFTMLSCHLIREASRINRQWFDRSGRKCWFVNLSEKGLRYTNTDSHNGVTMSCNLNQIIPASSAEWLMQDEGRCAYEVNKAAGGQLCFIDLKHGAAKSTKVVSEDDPLTSILPGLNVQYAGGSGSNITDKETPPSPTPETPGDDRKPSGNQPGDKPVPDKNRDDRAKGAGSGKAVNDSSPSKKKRPKTTKKNHEGKNDGKVVQGSLFDEATEAQMSSALDGEKEINVAHFIEWMHVNADWDISPCKRKSFPYQSTLQRYLNDTESELTLRELTKALEALGFVRICVEDKQLMAVPEEANV